MADRWTDALENELNKRDKSGRRWETRQGRTSAHASSLALDQRFINSFAGSASLQTINLFVVSFHCLDSQIVQLFVPDQRL